MLDDFEIRNKLSYIIMNNIDFNNRLIATIATALNKEEVFYNIKQRRLRYNNHVINLAIQVFLFKKIIDNYKFLENLTNSSINA